MRASIKVRRPTTLSTTELPAAISRIGAMTIEQLRAEWVVVFKAAPSSGLSKDVMARELAYRLQERALGSSSPEIRRMLRSIEKGNDLPRQIKLGSVIVREHQGTLHEVFVVPGGFSWKGKTYASLSTIARLITGTSWNGPRFFGLRAKRREECQAEAADDERGEIGGDSSSRRGRPSSVRASAANSIVDPAEQPERDVGARSSA